MTLAAAVLVYVLTQSNTLKVARSPPDADCCTFRREVRRLACDVVDYGDAQQVPVVAVRIQEPNAISAHTLMLLHNTLYHSLPQHPMP
jgi:hypothetical protein